MPLAILFCFAPLLTTAEKLRKKVQKFSGDRQFGAENRWQVDIDQRARLGRYMNFPCAGDQHL
jgi:hypothetical protein